MKVEIYNIGTRKVISVDSKLAEALVKMRRASYDIPTDLKSPVSQKQNYNTRMMTAEAPASKPAPVAADPVVNSMVTGTTSFSTPAPTPVPVPVKVEDVPVKPVTPTPTPEPAPKPVVEEVKPLAVNPANSATENEEPKKRGRPSTKSKDE